MGKFNALLDALGIVGKEAKAVGDDAAKAIEKVTSDEIGVNLTGEARKQYLNALDQVYGPQSLREKMVFDPTKPTMQGSIRKEPFFDSTMIRLADKKNPTTNVAFGINPQISKLDDVTKELILERQNIADDKSFSKFDKNKILKSIDDQIDQVIAEKDRLTYPGESQKLKLKKQIKENQLKDVEAKRNELFWDKEKGRPYMSRADRALKSDIIKAENAKLKTAKEEFKKANQKWEGEFWARGQSDEPVVFQPKGEITKGMVSPSEIEKMRSKFAAFDPRFKNSKLLMAGGLAGANIGDINEMLPKGERYKRALDEELSMVPKEMLQKGLHWWEKQKEKVTKPLAESLLQNPSLANLPPEVQQKLQGPISPEALSKGLSAVFDPVNLISGPAGLAAGAAQMLTPSDEEMAKQEQEQAMRRKVLNQLAGQ